MRRPYERPDLMATNDRQAQERKKLDAYERRKQTYRDKRRLLSLLTPLVQSGAMRKW